MKNKSQGFSLIELAIVMIGLGVLFALIAPIYTLYQKNQALSATDRNVQSVSAAIANFRTLYGRYPCPASLTVSRTDPQYGREGTCSAGTYSGLSFGTCHTSGICRQRSINSRTDGAGIWIPSLAGAIPFRTLNLQENEAYDGYDMRLRYVVTEKLTDSATFDLDGGGVEIRNDQDDSLLDVPGSAHFVIISHGPDKVGAYSKAGTQIPCTGSGPEIQNCLMSPGGGPGPSGCSGTGGMCTVYRAVQSSTNPATYFDDNLTYFVRDDIPLWTASSIDPLDIHQATMGGDVGFSIDPNSSGGTQDTVAGSSGIIRTMQALMADQFCNIIGGDCFLASQIAGNKADNSGGLVCPDGDPDGVGKFMTGIQNGAPICEDDITISCPSGSFIVGFNPDNTFKCAVGSCEPQSIGVCSDTYNLPLGAEDQSLTFTGGVNKYKTYTCTSVGWEVTAEGGVCDCIPDTVYVSNACGAVDGWSGSGSIDQQQDYICDLNGDGVANDPGYTDWTITSNSCVCSDGATETRTLACAPGWTGNIIEERTHYCDPDGDPMTDDAAWGPWVETSNTCTCTPDVKDRTLTCPTGFSGTGTYQENTFTCPAATWSGWTDVSKDCTCDSSYSQVGSEGCPAGYSGSRDTIRYFECPAGTWGPWQVTADNCVADPIAICNWKTSGTGDASTYAISSEPKGGSCVCGQEGPCYEFLTADSFYNYNVCRCE